MTTDTVTITASEIEAHRPDVLLPPDTEFADRYAEDVENGRLVATDSSVSFVAICRNAMPWLPQTLALLEETGSMFREWSAFIYENDSSDDTKAVLAEWHDGDQRQCSLNVNGRPHLNYTTAPERTHALAEYRTACQDWVRRGPRTDYVVVFDTDAWGGWSVDGLATSVLCLLDSQGDVSCAASYSWGEMPSVNGPWPIHYDAFACRWNHWRQRDQQWFHMWHPPVGSRPIPMNSAFGQLAIYRGDAYLAGRYSGEDCEHVTFHRSMPDQLVLNPSSRCVSFWVAGHGQHGSD